MNSFQTPSFDTGHLSDLELGRILDAAGLPPRATLHLSGCPTCRGRLQRAAHAELLLVQAAASLDEVASFPWASPSAATEETNAFDMLASLCDEASGVHRVSRRSLEPWLFASVRRWSRGHDRLLGGLQRAASFCIAVAMIGGASLLPFLAHPVKPAAAPGEASSWPMAGCHPSQLWRPSVTQ